ncbi:MAG: arginine repressor [Bdellovibrionales bacterium]|nr:arginine repressor [Bdellovibrionales bacterium]
MSSRTIDPMNRLSALRELLAEGRISTQEELVEELRAQKFVVTQSTISRDLGRLSAVKTRDASGRVIYKLPEDVMASVPVNTDLKGLLIDISHNGSLIVVHTTPGSANLLARQIDTSKPEGILGTIAGDDTIFVAPSSAKRIGETVKAIIEEFS